jgi:arylsulfatase A-like enzyme/Flp pilus assembly protein TadD
MKGRSLAIGALRALGALGALAVAGGASGCRRAAPPPIVLVSIDTLRADHLPVYGYGKPTAPAIDSLAKDAVLFDAAYAHYPLTLPSHVSLLTGLLPPRNGVRDNVGYTLDAAQHPTLAALLAARGYATGGFVASYVLRPETGIAAGFASYDAPPGPRRGAPMDSAQRSAAATLAPALAWVEAHREAPFFLFLHFYEPHGPYSPPEPYASRFDLPYDGEIATADAALGELIAALRRLDLYDRAVIALVSDHGEGLGEHGEEGHGVFLYRSTLHVPVLLKQPRARGAGARIAAPVGLVDLAPTLLRFAGAPLPAALDGMDLERTIDGGAPARGLYAETYYPRLHFGWSDLQALIESRWYFVRAPRPELYDLAADPRQERDVLAQNRREFARMEREVESLNAPLAAPSAADQATERGLQALGYLTGAAVPAAGRPDPKERVAVLAGIERGLWNMLAGHDEGAVAAFREVLQTDPGMTEIWTFLAQALERQNDQDGAVAAWEQALRLGHDPGVAGHLARSYLARGEFEKARALAESLGDGVPAAAEVLIDLDLRAGRRADAHRRMEQAVASGGGSEDVRRRLAFEALVEKRPQDAVSLLDPLGEDVESPTLIVRSLALADTGLEEEGAKTLEQARRRSSSAGGFFEDLGVALLSLDRLEQAHVALEQAVAAAPDQAGAWNSLGVAAARRGQSAKAMAAWQRAVAIDPALYDAWFNLGLTAARSAQPALARRAMNEYLRRAPRDFVVQRKRAAEILRTAR